MNFDLFETVDVCPVCGSADFAVVYHPDINRCERCEITFRSPRPTQAEIKRSYDSGATFASWRLETGIREILFRKRLDLILPFKAGGDLLDVGAGDGHFLEIAQEKFSVSGTDLSSTAARFASERGQQVAIGQLHDLDFPENWFDVITMWHVLEHVPAPGEVLTEARRLLKSDGIFAAAVPNEENFLFKERIKARIGRRTNPNPFGRIQWGQEIHLTHFQPRTLRSVLARFGFETVVFGVDDVYIDRSAGNLVRLAMQRFINGLVGWHFSRAMVAVCRKSR
ncbi:MAG TPA: class I SAM-dependent methyltransferase [Anaerolineales bacterium]|nr:class I SAM-dependent methyltransferase [Anaerolineales bacterium]